MTTQSKEKIEDKKDLSYFSKTKLISIGLVNGFSDAGITDMVPFVKTDEGFGNTFLRYKDVNGTWHNLRSDLVASINIIDYEKAQEEENKYNASLGLNQNEFIKTLRNNKQEDERW